MPKAFFCLKTEVLGDILGDIIKTGASQIRETPLIIGSAGNTRTYNPSVSSHIRRGPRNVGFPIADYRGCDCGHERLYFVHAAVENTEPGARNCTCDCTD